MFTVEMDHDETKVTVLDDYGYNEDVEFVIYDDMVYIQQWDEDLGTFNVIYMSPEMFDEFCEALNRPEGSYLTQKNS